MLAKDKKSYKIYIYGGVKMLLLSLLNDEEKGYFIDLLLKIIAFDGKVTPDDEQSIINTFQSELGEYKYQSSDKTFEELLEYFKEKSKVVKNIVLLNVFNVSLFDEWYSAEEHFMIEKVQENLGITEKKGLELKRLVYAARDLRERVKRVISE
jgi:hypothetical protein